MAIRSGILIGLLTFFSIGASSAPISSETLNPSAPKAISDLRDSIVKGLGFQGDGLKVSGFDVRDALVGQSVAYEFDIEVDNKKFPIKLLEDVSRWDFVDLPIFRAGDEEERGLAKKGVVLPVLSPFQLSGPMELWIQDGDDLRLALPHDVDAGTLKKVILSDGAVVTVKGARSVSLRHPLDLPLPLNRTSHNGRPIASALIAIAESLRHGSRNTEKPLLSVRIVGPTSLTSSPSASSNSNSKLKLKRLGPGLVELSSPIMALAETTESPQPLRLWPLMSLNGSDPNLRGFEELLASVLGKKGREDGSFKLVRAEVSARTYVKMSFELEQKLPEDRDWSGFPGWKTRPERARTHYEVIARVEDDGKVVPERIAQIQPFTASDSVQPSEQTGNATMSQLPIVHPPPDYFML